MRSMPVKPPRPNAYRDRWAGQLRKDDVGGEVRVAGWVHRRRDHGGLIFIDLRDRTGLLQVVFRPEEAAEAHKQAEAACAPRTSSRSPATWSTREAGAVNPDLPTGEVELVAREIELLADAETPPFEIEEGGQEANEELRLKYRYLDLRREHMRQGLRAAPRRDHRHPRLPERRGLPRGRDAGDDALDARGRARLPRAQPLPARLVVRAAAVAAALQADPDDRRLRALLPDRALLPRRGSARRPPARVHAARHGALVRRGGRRDRRSSTA